MPFHYLDPNDAALPGKLPDIEVFFVESVQFGPEPDSDAWMAERGEELKAEDPDGDPDYAELEGWYWHFCFPGCLPESGSMGPFGSEDEALFEARDNDSNA